MADEVVIPPVPTPEEIAAALRAEYQLPEAWTVAQVLAWAEAVKDLDPEAYKTTAGNWTFDPTRATRKYADMATDELMDQVFGRLLPAELSAAATKTLVTVLRGREGVVVDAAWSVEEVVAFLRYAQVPPKTEAGVWINDEVRDTRKAEQWTNDELDAWGRGQISHGIKATDKYLATELRKRFTLEATNALTPKEVKEIYLKKFDSSEVLGVTDTEGLTPVNQTYIIESLEVYKKAVSPGTVVSDNAGAKAQTTLDTVIAYVLRLEGPAFVAGMNILRDFFQANRGGLFETTYIYRFTHLMSIGQKRIDRHKDFLELLTIATDPNPQLIKQSDINALLINFTEGDAARLKDYFTNFVGQ